MACLMRVHDALAQHGDAQAQQISLWLSMPSQLVQASLDHLTKLGKVERIEQEEAEPSSSCLRGSCKGCPQLQHCPPVVTYRLKH